jgi:hypothetical protein
LARENGKACECVIRHAHAATPELDRLEFEVETPEVLNAEINYTEFREAVMQYYYDLFGPEGTFMGPLIKTIPPNLL